MEKVAWVRLTATVPLLVTVRLCTVAFPIGTFPKLILLKLTRKDAMVVVTLLEAFTTPAHPFSNRNGRMARASRREDSRLQFLRTTRSLLIPVQVLCLSVLAMTPLHSCSSYEGKGNGTVRPTGGRTNLGTAPATVPRAIFYLDHHLHLFIGEPVEFQAIIVRVFGAS